MAVRWPQALILAGLIELGFFAATVAVSSSSLDLPPAYTTADILLRAQRPAKVEAVAEAASGFSSALATLPRISSVGVPITDLGTLDGSSVAYGINASGQVVGGSVTSSGDSHAVLWQSGVMTDLGTLSGRTESSARGINAAGNVVGRSGADAFLWQSGVMMDLGPGEAWGINDAGQVVGDSSTSSGFSHAFLWQNGVMRDLGTLPGDVSSAAFGINGAGHVIGYSYVTYGGPSHAFLWHDGVMT